MNQTADVDLCVELPRLESAIRQVESDESFVSVEIDGATIERLARPGHRYWFEYHCWESHQSGDAKVWYHSHQQCTLLGFDKADPCFFSTFVGRGEAGHCLVYRVRFDDGLEWSVFEDELLTSPDEFWRPDPPSGPE